MLSLLGSRGVRHKRTQDSKKITKLTLFLLGEVSGAFLLLNTLIPRPDRC